jgi:hypothetical protein
MNRAIPLAVFAIILAEPAMAKETRFWNLTSSTVKSLELAPAGATAFRPNPCANDPDGAVDHDERVRVTGATTGAYDARLALADGRVCMAEAVGIETGKPFSLDDKDLVCAPPTLLRAARHPSGCAIPPARTTRSPVRSRKSTAASYWIKLRNWDHEPGASRL